MKVIHTDKVKPSRDHKPRDLKHAAKDRVEIRVPDVVGKTSPPWKYGIIHSKLMISDEYVPLYNQSVNIPNVEVLLFQQTFLSWKCQCRH